MKRIDISQWKEFRVGKLFDIHPTKAYKLTNKKLLDGGNTPVVVNSSYNNGIGGFSTKEPTEKGGMITFSDTVDAYTIFYQDSDFIGYPHVQGLYPVGEYTSCWNEYSLKFFATIFRQKAINNSFDYSYKFRRDIAINLNVLLPTTDEGDPNWEYMENYMREKLQEIAASTKALKHLTGTHKPKRIDTSKWKEFTLKELGFENFHGKRLTKAERKDGNTPFITAGKENQGIIGTIGNNWPTYINSITVDMFGNVFYHQGELAGDDNIYFFINDTLNEYVKLFIVVSLQSVIKSSFEYRDQFRQDNADNAKVYLPVSSSGEPDWNLMEQYMRQVEQQVKNSILALTTPTPQVQQQTNLVNYGTVNIYEK